MTVTDAGEGGGCRAQIQRPPDRWPKMHLNFLVRFENDQKGHKNTFYEKTYFCNIVGNEFSEEEIFFFKFSL